MKGTILFALTILLTSCGQQRPDTKSIPQSHDKASKKTSTPPTADAEPGAVTNVLPNKALQESLANVGDDRLNALASSYCNEGSIEQGKIFFSTSPLFFEYGIFLQKFARRLAASDPEKGY